MEQKTGKTPKEARGNHMKKFKRTKLTEENATKLHTGHIKMAWSHAGTFAAKFPKINPEDIKDEAESCLGLIIAEWANDEPPKGYPGPATCTPTGWIYWKMYYHLLTFCMRKQRKEMIFTDLSTGSQEAPSEEAQHQFPHQENRFDQILRMLGKDAQIIATTILHGPAELVEDLVSIATMRKKKTTNREQLAMTAINEFFDWPNTRFLQAWEEIREAL